MTTSPPDPLRIAIMGGCLNSGFQQVPLNSLYHRVMARAIEARHPTSVQVRLGRLMTHQTGPMLDETLRILRARRPRVLVLQLRPDFLCGLLTPLWLTRAGRGPSRLRLNPHLRHGPSWPEGAEASLCIMRRFPAANLLLGRLLRVRPVALDRLDTLLRAVQSACAEHGARLLLIGPIFGPWYGATFENHLQQILAPRLRTLRIPCVESASAIPHSRAECWAPDGIHLNSAGHQVMATLLVEQVEKMVFQEQAE